MTTAKERSPETTLDHQIQRTVDQQPERLNAPPPPAACSAHDLGNFVAGIQMLVQSLSPDEPIPREHIVALQRSVLHASELCEQLQKELAGEQVDLKLSEIDLGELVSATRRYLEVIVRPDTKLNIKAASGLPLILANPMQLQQVVNDLISNAADALGNDGGRITVRTDVFHVRDVDVRGDGDGDGDRYVFLEVADTGHGIAEDELRQMFAPRFTTKKDGHGLGLASVLQIVRSYGGAVKAESRLGKGTRVRCHFPLAASEELKQADSVVENIDARAATILLVEDNDMIRYCTKRLLENCAASNYSVLTARNGEEALKLLRQRRDDISLAILDLHLPDCSGASLFRSMRELVSELPVIVVSGVLEDELIAQCEGQKPNDFLVKPFAVAALIQKVNSTLGSSQSLSARESHRPARGSVRFGRTTGADKFASKRPAADLTTRQMCSDLPRRSSLAHPLRPR